MDMEDGQDDNFAIRRFLKTDMPDCCAPKYEELKEGQAILNWNCTMRGGKRPPLWKLKLPVKAMAREGDEIPIFRQPRGLSEGHRSSGRGRAGVLRDRVARLGREEIEREEKERHDCRERENQKKTE
jgi:hypothetical protein